MSEQPHDKDEASEPRPGDEIKPSRYRKLPVEIEAIRWCGTNLKAVIDFTGRHESSEHWTWEHFEEVVRTKGLKIFSLEGSKFIVTVGDYIIKGVSGEFYACKPDIFWKTYQRVTALPELQHSERPREVDDEANRLTYDTNALRFYDALERAARIIEKRAEDRIHSTCSYDHETGAWEYPGHAEDVGNALDEEAEDCAKAIRALKDQRTVEPAPNGDGSYPDTGKPISSKASGSTISQLEKCRFYQQECTCGGRGLVPSDCT